MTARMDQTAFQTLVPTLRLLGVTSIVTLAAATAYARGTEEAGKVEVEDHEPQDEGRNVDLRGQVTFFATEIEGMEVWHVSPELRARVRVLERADVGIKWGFAAQGQETRGGDDRGGGVGNPFLYADYVEGFRDGTMKLRVGGGIALPFSVVTDGFVQQTALAGATVARGSREAWLWFADMLGLVAPRGSVAYRHSSGFGIRGELGVAVFVPVQNRERLSTEWTFRTAADVGYKVGLVEFGVGLQNVILTGPPRASDDSQFSVEPFLSVGRDTGFGYGRVTLNIDGPNGFTTESDIYGIHVGGGGAW